MWTSTETRKTVLRDLEHFLTVFGVLTSVIKPCKFCMSVDKALKQQFKRHKRIGNHEKINHKYLTKKQLSQKVAAKVKKESQHKCQLQKNKAKINELNAAVTSDAPGDCKFDKRSHRSYFGRT